MASPWCGDLTIKIPPYQGKNEIRVTPTSIDQWAHDGWVDLRETNMTLWRVRFAQIIREVEALPETETSSRTMHNREYWKNLTEIDPGRSADGSSPMRKKGRE